MAATQKDIQQWLVQAQQAGATHVIVACDTFDWTDYPVNVKPDQRIEEQIANIHFQSMQKVMEVYNLAFPIEPQLSEKRAWNL